MDKRPIQSGVIAGFVATIALSALMVMKGAIDLVPQLNVIHMLDAIMGTQGAPAAGWIVHFTIGTLIWGGLFGLLDTWIPSDSRVLKGMAFATCAWLLMMGIVMPVAGAGLFGARIGMIAPVVTLALHLVYGAVLGGFYGWLVRHHPAPTADMWPGGQEQ